MIVKPITQFTVLEKKRNITLVKHFISKILENIEESEVELLKE